MNLGELYSYVDYIANKDQLGEPLGPENYRLLLSVVNSQYYKTEFGKILLALDKPGDAILKVFNNSPLYRFLSEGTLVVASGVAPLPTDLGYTIDGTALLDGGWKFARFLSVEAADKLKYTILTAARAKKVVFTQTPSGYNFIPNTIVSAKVNYLRQAIAPVFDYCMGPADNIYYMPVGSSITAAGDLVDSSATLIVAGVTHSGSPTLPYTSLSVEFDWDEVDRVKLADMIIEMATIRSREFNVTAAIDQVSKQ